MRIGDRLSGRLAGLVLAALVMAFLPLSEVNSQGFASETPSLQERRHMRDQERRFANEAEYTGKQCGTSISTSIHWESFNTRGTGAYVVGDCDVALSAIERICREDKSRVQGAIRHVQCGAASKRDVRLSGSTLQYAVGARRQGDDHEYVYRFLKRKL